MTHPLKNAYLPTVLVFLVFVFGVAVLSILGNDEDSSVLERRALAQSPSIDFAAILDGDFSEDYATYLQDQMVVRDDFRFVKSFVERVILRKPENNGVYVVDGRLYDKFYGIEELLISRAARLINSIAQDSGSNAIYFSTIPTKAQILDRDRFLLSDQQIITDAIRQGVDANYVDLMWLAQPGNEELYYATDPHWTTPGALSAYKALASALGFDPVDTYEFEIETDTYRGSEYGRAASWSIGDDTVLLAHNDSIDGMSLCRFSSLEERKCFESVYLQEGENTMDAYDVFLGGLGPIITIDNPSSSTDAELVIFKDSYAHAVAPFLAQHYKTVTLIDMRFVRRQLVLDNFSLAEKDILFLYSTSVLNTDPQILN
ncbi:MAG: hypothetical protein HOC77_08820 [Chloroflexi bacterium]|jgi:hypothetical protein|nr:hypothetical protein [Chloroflexota bacterium]MBT4074340.1 hypothetical protein [Chloroflexota bacterium]MBT4515173.1 hypothetical protein [Chloroflexota bacterium]MBT5319750.1 hypothetical protein [Chloroflexota bacterium]MBT6681550.1 hypothetical protein [Chloroflexota bacterium]